MKKNYFAILSFIVFVFNSNAQVSIPIYDNVLFYDGYASLVNYPTEPDVIRLRNDLFTKKLTPEVLAQIGTSLTLNISISAACDNYDRIGNINLALVPKGATSYNPDTTNRLELGRYITPFMNKNVPPNLVPYTFSVDNITKILKDTYLNTIYDFWIEFELFGVPYAAQTQISGCSGRNDVFYGTLNFITNTETSSPNNTYIHSLNFKKILNDYQAGASDGIFQTVRTIYFDLPSAINNAKFYLITSSHGANAGGEEYNRRWHYISLNSNQILSYLPGEPTCEPYRVFNTQGNGIYGTTPRTPEEWQSFSNWCPGAVIPIREMDLGNLAAGNHMFRIAVPTAVFVGNEGYIPVSLYLQGENTALNVDDFEAIIVDHYPNPTKNKVFISCRKIIDAIEIVDLQGKIIESKVVENTETEVDFTQFSNGVYFIKMKLGEVTKTHKIIKE